MLSFRPLSKIYNAWRHKYPVYLLKTVPEMVFFVAGPKCLRNLICAQKNHKKLIEDGKLVSLHAIEKSELTFKYNIGCNRAYQSQPAVLLW